MVEKNRFIDNARAVGFGLTESGDGRTYSENPCPGASGYVDHFGGIIRNNFIFASNPALFASESGADTGIALWQACNSKVYHNSLAFTETPFSAIEYRFSNTQADIMNNLTTHNIMQRNNARANLAGNLQLQPLTLFADGISGDLHLNKTATSAIDMGVELAEG